MHRQKSQLTAREHGEFSSSHKTGTLFLVSTPIGHPDDISLRALKVLGAVHIIAAESPPSIQKLLTRHSIQATITSYGPKNLAEKVLLLIDRLRKGQDVALVVEGGTPVIHDPGQLLIAAAHKNRLSVKVIPGPSAVTASIALSGYCGDRFVFAGELPQTDRSLLPFLKTFLDERRPVIFLTDPGALPKALNHMTNLFGTRELTLAVDLTKSGELVLRGTAAFLITKMTLMPHCAEITLVLEEKKGRSRVYGSKKAGRATRRHCGDG